MGGAAAGTKWIHHIQRLSAAKVSTEAVERGQSRVIDASLTLIRERAKLKVSACIHSPAHSIPIFSQPSPDPTNTLLFCIRSCSSEYSIPRKYAIRVDWDASFVPHFGPINGDQSVTLKANRQNFFCPAFRPSFSGVDSMSVRYCR